VAEEEAAIGGGQAIGGGAAEGNIKLIINSISYECNVIMFFTCIIVVENLGE
jgi:hypothetical protein